MGQGSVGLVPEALVPYLSPAPRPGAHHAELAPLRREALDVLAVGYRSTGRTLLGVLAWLASVSGATTLALLPGTEPTTAAALTVLGVLLLAGGLWTGWAVVRSGRRITSAAARWLQVPTAGGADADRLHAVVRWRAVLGAGVATAALAVLATLGYLTAQTTGRAALGLPATATTTGSGVAVVALGAAGLALAAAAVATLGGAWRVHEAASRPVAALVPAATAAGVPGWGLVPGSPPVAEPYRAAPPTVAIDLSGVRPVPPRPTPERGAPHGQAPEHAASPGGGGTPVTVEVLLPDGRALGPGATLVGRRPVSRPEDVVDSHVVLTDQTVTKTHATITLGPDGVQVVDRASTNGTLLEAPDGSLLRCKPWQVTTVHAPAIIHLGHTRLLVRPVNQRTHEVT